MAAVGRLVVLWGHPRRDAVRCGAVQVIGRVAGLTSLNGASIRPRERKDCELRYLQHIAAEMSQAAAKGGQDAVAAVRASHPRLRYLMETYGAVL